MKSSIIQRDLIFRFAVLSASTVRSLMLFRVGLRAQKCLIRSSRREENLSKRTEYEASPSIVFGMLKRIRRV